MQRIATHYCLPPRVYSTSYSEPTIFAFLKIDRVVLDIFDFKINHFFTYFVIAHV